MTTAIAQTFDTGRFEPAVRRDAHVYRDELTVGVIAFVVFHLVIGPIFYEIRQLAVLHAFIVSGIGFWWAIKRDKPLEWVAYAGAYITGAEVLWRVARVSGPVLYYEFAKYLLTSLFIVALVVRGRLSVRGRWAAVGYFALLLPSALIPLTELDFSIAREDISFNLSGPLTVMVSAVFFGQVDIARLKRRSVLLALMGPILSIAAISVVLMITRDVVFQSGAANREASGNFGPNQVSAVLGLAGLAAFFCIMDDKASRGLRLLMFALMTFMLVQSALTFSRGGLYSFAAASLVGILYLAKDARKRFRSIIVGLLLLGLADYVVVPRLDELTGGTLTTRFQDTRLTGRDELIRSELEVWSENPVLGVGPGQAMYHRDVSVIYAAAHTEFTRTLAEHGVFGLGALLMLFAMVFQSLRNGTVTSQRAFALSGWTWSCLFMLSNGMRVLAPAFVMGLSTVAPQKQNKKSRARRRTYFRQLYGSPLQKRTQSASVELSHKHVRHLRHRPS